MLPDKRVTMPSKVSKSSEMKRNHLVLGLVFFFPVMRGLGVVVGFWGFILETPIGPNSVSGFSETDPFTDYLGLTVLLTIMRNNYLYFSV